MEKIRFTSDCYSCVARLQLEKYPKDCPEELQIEYKRRVLKLLAETEPTNSAPMVLKDIEEIRQELFGKTTDYQEIKLFYNEYVMKKLPIIEADIAGADEGLLRALQYSMTGNYIDFGAMETVDNDKFEQMLANAGSINLDATEYDNFKKELAAAKSFVLLTDNCGEIVFDKALIRYLKKAYPKLQITVVVRGKDIINDATMDDARQIGLTEDVCVIGNGNGVAGTCLELLNDEAKAVIEGADVLLAKGQANFETLMECGLNIYYLFLCKCARFVKRFHAKQYTGLMLNDRRLSI